MYSCVYGMLFRLYLYIEIIFWTYAILPAPISIRALISAYESVSAIWFEHMFLMTALPLFFFPMNRSSTLNPNANISQALHLHKKQVDIMARCLLQPDIAQARGVRHFQLVTGSNWLESSLVPFQICSKVKNSVA
ncbi:hypothetical protein BT96DRAFT_474241 [Gymnopus androsaceus JB14]|uniref:Uncharacterized protein n=1 Tax=Gymnopus androsaceus JB14 TaxID=1447944 RepID=A0A6A4I4N6_9AGAR|nr:hypothetical protein BT96DRAFT_474241 [Gymnopus androsaceus JB14]